MPVPELHEDHISGAPIDQEKTLVQYLGVVADEKQKEDGDLLLDDERGILRHIRETYDRVPEGETDPLGEITDEQFDAVMRMYGILKSHVSGASRTRLDTLVVEVENNRLEEDIRNEEEDNALKTAKEKAVERMMLGKTGSIVGFHALELYQVVDDLQEEGVDIDPDVIYGPGFKDKFKAVMRACMVFNVSVGEILDAPGNTELERASYIINNVVPLSFTELGETESDRVFAQNEQREIIAALLVQRILRTHENALREAAIQESYGEDGERHDQTKSPESNDDHLYFTRQDDAYYKGQMIFDAFETLAKRSTTSMVETAENFKEIIVDIGIKNYDQARQELDRLQNAAQEAFVGSMEENIQALGSALGLTEEEIGELDIEFLTRFLMIGRTTQATTLNTLRKEGVEGVLDKLRQGTGRVQANPETRLFIQRILDWSLIEGTNDDTERSVEMEGNVEVVVDDVFEALRDKLGEAEGLKQTFKELWKEHATLDDALILLQLHDAAEKTDNPDGREMILVSAGFNMSLMFMEWGGPNSGDNFRQLSGACVDSINKYLDHDFIGRELSENERASAMTHYKLRDINLPKKLEDVVDGTLWGVGRGFDYNPWLTGAIIALLATPYAMLVLRPTLFYWLTGRRMNRLARQAIEEERLRQVARDQRSQTRERTTETRNQIEDDLRTANDAVVRAVQGVNTATEHNLEERMRALNTALTDLEKIVQEYEFEQSRRNLGLRNTGTILEQKIAEIRAEVEAEVAKGGQIDTNALISRLAQISGRAQSRVRAGQDARAGGRRGS